MCVTAEDHGDQTRCCMLLRLHLTKLGSVPLETVFCAWLEVDKLLAQDDNWLLLALSITG